MSPHRDLFLRRTWVWLEDPASSVEHVEEVDGRWATRMLQEVRDATTVWWTIGERSIKAEAYVLPAPVEDPREVFRQCLVRNRRSWRCHFALDEEGAVVIRGRIAAEAVTDLELDLLLGEIYELVEVSFPGLVRAGFGGGPSREKTS